MNNSAASSEPSSSSQPANPWRALWALCVGFFMILVDSTIVSVAMPDIMASLGADINAVVWVTSAYLLAYVVPLLITGRLGDKYGPKRVYLVGLVVFTLASLWCGLTASVGALIAARVVQGLGAAAMTPQTMAVITRVFPPDRRGPAMGLWGAVAGIATLLGPIIGGLLVDGFGWEWIFFVNVPVGLIGLVLAWRLVPRLQTHPHSFDWLGVVLSACGMFLLVYGIQQAHAVEWGPLIGPITVPFVIGGGLAFLVAFVLWQKHTTAEVLVPLSLFRDRNFSLACVAMTTVGFGVTSMAFPFMLWAQNVLGYTPTQAALLLAPMAVVSTLLAPFVGRMVDTGNPRLLAGIGLAAFSVGLFWLGALLDANSSPWRVVPAIVLLGVANGFMWAPISSTATRNLPLHYAGAGSGVYNTVRQVGAVLGSAAIAVAMEARLEANIGDASGMASGGEAGVGGSGGAGASGGVGAGAGGAGGGVGPDGSGMPEAIASGFADAMGQALWVPAAVVVIGFIAVMFFERRKPRVER